jgi:hypothetical protein
MSDTKRTFETVQTEYQQLALKAGHIQYQIHALSKDLDLLNDQMRDLNFEGAKIKTEEEKLSSEKKEA